jgi:hypothetical protein
MVKYRDSKDAPPQMAEMSGVMKEETKALVCAGVGVWDGGW